MSKHTPGRESVGAYLRHLIEVAESKPSKLDDEIERTVRDMGSAHMIIEGACTQILRLEAAYLLGTCEAIRDMVREKNELVSNAREAGNNDQVYRLLRHLADQIELVAEYAISKSKKIP